MSSSQQEAGEHGARGTPRTHQTAWQRVPGVALAVGTVELGVRTTAGAGRLVTGAARPVIGLALRPARRQVSAVLDLVVPAVVSEVLRRVDVAEALHEHVDVDRVVADVDIDAIIDRIDLVGLVNQVIDEVDLPEIIRESTGSIGSETVRGIRMHGISADEAVDRVLDRFRVHHRPATPEARAQDPT